ncbi:MAG TPA: cobalt-precorrin-6A reductase [Stellaceae bacterium]|jgi:precorrin-6A/cobalt-precorrin-6A reductase
MPDLTTPRAGAAGADLMVLVLGGTSEGFDLARALTREPAARVVSSLAGRTANPRLPIGEVRIGGFGGADGLAAYLRSTGVGMVIDATHPFAATMGGNAEEGCRQAGVPLLRLERPAWRPIAGDNWTEVDDWDEAANAVGKLSQRVLLAVGRRELAAFAALDHVWFLVRSVDPPNPVPAFRQAELLLARGPFALDDERRLLAGHRIDTILCRNSGGSAADAKLVAARELGIRVVIRRRPPRPAGLPRVSSVSEAILWVRSMCGR